MEPLKHECGVAMIRLLKPLTYYEEKYGSQLYALNKLYLLMEKQHNRGQEGAGLACVRLSVKPGDEYMFRERASGATAITEIFNAVRQRQLESAALGEGLSPFVGELYMGHLRYSTTGKSGLDYIHPFLRRNNWRAKNLALCGNFNLTNVDEVFRRIVANGQHPRKYADTHIMLEQVGHRLDREVERVYNRCCAEGKTGLDLTHAIERRIDMANVLRTSSGYWDGGYVMCGITGSGESFALRDPWGIRTAFWYQDDEVLVLTSERPVIQTVFDVAAEAIHERLTLLCPYEPAPSSVSTSAVAATKTSIKSVRSWAVVWWIRSCQRSISILSTPSSPTYPTPPRWLSSDLWRGWTTT